MFFKIEIKGRRRAEKREGYAAASYGEGYTALGQGAGKFVHTHKQTKSSSDIQYNTVDVIIK